LREKLSF